MFRDRAPFSSFSYVWHSASPRPTLSAAILRAKVLWAVILRAGVAPAVIGLTALGAWSEPPASNASPIAQDALALATPGAAPWQPLHFPKIAAHTEYAVLNTDGASALRATSRCAASALTHDLAPLHRDAKSNAPTNLLDRFPILEWRWRVPGPLDLAHEKTKREDDFAARVYVMFEFDAARASWIEKARHSLGQKIYGAQVPGNAINYVWTSRVPAGETWTSPYTENAKLVSLGFGTLKEWKQERVDVAADYRKLFGAAPPPVLAIAVMSDSDNSCRTTEAWFAEISLRARPQSPP